MPAKILIVEDDHVIAQMYGFKLRHCGYEVRLAANGQEGLVLAESFMPQIILLDLSMPIMNGDKMLEKMRSTAWGSSIKIIVLTNISKSEAPMSLRLLGVDRYLVKAHHTPGQVVEVVQEVLIRHSSQKNLLQ
ncbi:hypothetical protein BH23PAT1_BH23PAT1_3290 [soil metagenome]